jgi:hypothetical protein
VPLYAISIPRYIEWMGRNGGGKVLVNAAPAAAAAAHLVIDCYIPDEG